MNVLGLIPARGGSKGIPRKNLAPCGGRPLIAWTCLAAGKATCLSRVIVSTDDVEIAAVARAHGIAAPFVRPAELASDGAKSIDVALHAVDWLAEHESWTADVVVLLQPTSPLRTARHIDDAFALLMPELDSVVSVMEVPHRFNPWMVLALEDGVLEYASKAEVAFDRHRRQGQPIRYARNGPAVIVSQTRTLRGGSFYGDRSAPYVMPERDSLDIDEPYDLEIADWRLGRR